MLAVMEGFAVGRSMILNKDLKELGSMMRLPGFRGWWEFRSQGPMTETRLFGFFARRGAFVGVDFRSRDEFGDRKDPRWGAAHAESIRRWDALTGGATYLTEPWPVELRSQLAAYTDGADDD